MISKKVNEMVDLESMIEKIIKKNISNDYLIGFSYLEGLVPKKFKRLNYGITIGIRLDDKIIDGIVNGPTDEYAEHYDQINTVLNNIAREVRRNLKRQGYKAEIIKATIKTGEEKKYPNYSKNLSVEFPHKTAATRSGLGWIGKTALLVSPKFGPRIRLVTILTNKKLVTGQPVKKSLCGTCDICVKKCPAKAANGKTWSVGMQRDEFFDAFECRSTAKELGMQRTGSKECICGICVSVCPLGKK